MIALRRPHSKRDWFSIVAGAIFLWFSGMALFMGLQSSLWPKAPGVVTYSTAYSYVRIYQIDVRYSYTYQDQQYSGTRYRFRFWLNKDRTSLVDAVQSRYKIGEAVNVAVNPRDPSDAVLEPGVDTFSFIWPAFGLLLIFGGLIDTRDRATRATVPLPTHRHATANFLLFVGLATLLLGSHPLYSGFSSLSWPIADGRILDSKAHSDGNNYRTQLWYEYEVEGVRHVSENYHTGGNGTVSTDTAKAVAKRYPVGRQVKVFFNPSDPSESVLEPGPWFGNFILPSISLVILLTAWVAWKISHV
ncbi:MAG: DUF3592 domain-containing protein [Acidobacteriota bacterium]